MALLFAKEGALVVVSARSPAEIEDVAREAENMGQRALAVRADVSREEDVKNLIGETLDAFKGIDILVNNAATNLPDRDVIDLTVSEWNRMFEVNVTGPFLCCRTVLPSMIQQGSGKIINISSFGARYPRAGRSAYRSSKLALLQFTFCLAAEVKKYGIDVNAVCPGPTETRMAQQIAPGSSHRALMHPEEIAEVVLFLASPQSSAITGTAIEAFGPRNPIFE